MAGAVPVLANDRGLSMQVQGRKTRPKSLADGIPMETMNDINNDRIREGLGNKAKSTAALSDMRNEQQQQNQQEQKVVKKPPPVAPKPKTARKPVKEVVLHRNENEGFGFVIMSSQNCKGSVIGLVFKIFVGFLHNSQSYRHKHMIMLCLIPRIFPTETVRKLLPLDKPSFKV